MIVMGLCGGPHDRCDDLDNDGSFDDGFDNGRCGLLKLRLILSKVGLSSDAHMWVMGITISIYQIPCNTFIFSFSLVISWLYLNKAADIFLFYCNSFCCC